MKRAVAWALSVAWMLLIFIMSAMPGEVSGEQSGTIVELLLRAEEALFGEEAACAANAQLLETLVRKAAHMAEYAVLLLLLSRALSLSGARRPALCALILCALYASTDEFHQCFVSGRGPSPVDVCIDTAGALIACAVRAGWRRIRHLS